MQGLACDFLLTNSNSSGCNSTKGTFLSGSPAELHFALDGSSTRRLLQTSINVLPITRHQFAFGCPVRGFSLSSRSDLRPCRLNTRPVRDIMSVEKSVASKTRPVGEQHQAPWSSSPTVSCLLKPVPRQRLLKKVVKYISTLGHIECSLFLDI